MKSFFSFLRIARRRAGGLAFTVLAASTVAGAGHAALRSSSAAAQDKPLVVAMHYVIPEFVGGQKVRTPEAPDAALADALAMMLGASGAVSVHADASAGERILSGEADVALLFLSDGGASLPDGLVALATGYRSRPMAIMRTDTDITSWAQLRGRTVCVAEGGLYAGQVAELYGAVEQVYRAPADSLLALRIGQCDAAVHDEALFRDLLKLPEWKKFSASLPPGPSRDLVLALHRDNTAVRDAAQKLIRRWNAGGDLSSLLKQRANDIAFEVYLDQEVPDCH